MMRMNTIVTVMVIIFLSTACVLCANAEITDSSNVLELGIGEVISISITGKSDSSQINIIADNENVVQIDQAACEVKGLTTGVTSISASLNGEVIETIIARVYNEPKQLTAGKLRIAEHQTAKINAMVEKGAFSHFIYEAKDNSVISVDTEGNVTAIREGKSIVTVYSYNGMKADCEIEVYKPVYRALLIGEVNYKQNPLNTDQDIEIMSNMLTHVNNRGYENNITIGIDTKASDFEKLINSAFAGATEDDVSLFYYSGHGNEDLWEPKELEVIEGDLATVDEKSVSLVDVSQWLNNIPGKIIVVLDTCRSGIGVENYDNAAQEMLSKILTFDRSNVGVFRNYGKFYVITGSSYRENAIDTSEGVGGLLTNALAYTVNQSVGFNEDSSISLGEIEVGVRDYIGKTRYTGQQNPQFFPQDSRYVLFWNTNEEKEDTFGGITEEISQQSARQNMGNSASNLTSGGYIVETNQDVVFSDGTALWILNESTNHATKLVDGSYSSLNYWDGYIYAVKNEIKIGKIYTSYWNTRCVYDLDSYDDNDFYEDAVREACIVKIGLDGSMSTITTPLTENVAGVQEYSNMVIVDGQIYYIGSNEHGGSFYESWYDWESEIEYDRAEYRYRRGNSIYRMNLDGNNKTEIIADAGNFESIFTTDGDNIVVIRGYDNFSADGITDYIVTDMTGNQMTQFVDPVFITDWLPLLHNGEVLSIAYGGSGDEFPAIMKYSLDGKEIKQMNLNTANCAPVVFKDALYYYTCLNIDAMYYGGNITANDFAVMCVDIDGSSNELIYTGPELSQSGYDELWCINAKLSATSNYIYLEELEYDSGRQMCKRLYRLDTNNRILERVELGDRTSNADSTLVVKSYTGYVDIEFERHDHSIYDDKKSFMAYYDLPIISGKGNAVQKINSALREDYKEYVLEIDQILTDEYTHWEWTTIEDPYAYYIDVTQGIYLWDDGYEIEGGVQYDRNDIVSIAACGYWMMGGVNGRPLYTYTFNTQTGNSLSLHELFSNWNEEKLLSTIKDSICVVLGDYVDTDSDSFRNLQLSDIVFFVSDNGEIILCLENYQLGAATSIGPIISTGMYLGDDRRETFENGQEFEDDTLYDKLIEKVGNASILTYRQTDYDKDGVDEAFALISYREDDGIMNIYANLWFISNDIIICVEEGGGCYYNESQLLDWGDNYVFEVVEGYGEGVFKRRYWTVENGKPYLAQGEYLKNTYVLDKNLWWDVNSPSNDFEVSNATCIIIGDVNMREEPNLQGGIIISIPKGTTVDYLGEVSTDERGVDWYKIRYKEKTGWASSKYARLN